MCGIAGVIWKRPASPADRERFRSAADLSWHRGPDHSGHHAVGPLELVHHRLSILDLSSRSDQPFFSADKSQVIVFNGEIYNYRDLANEHHLALSTSSDTEVLSLLLRQQGVGILPELNGVFAFALYDQDRQQLMLARDRYGVKPLYYYEDEELFMFASEAKVILNVLGRFQLEPRALAEYFRFGNITSSQTMIKGLKKLDPGTTLTVDLNSCSISTDTFWSIRRDILPVRNTDSFDQALRSTRDLLEKAVERQCISDVPVGAYLSGGIDSSTVVALASRYTASKLSTYSVDFDQVNGAGSERPFARKIARMFGTDHHEFQVSVAQVEGHLSDIVFQYDEPFADPAVLPLYLLAKACSGLSRVVLQGDGGDEVFAGYGSHLDLSELRLRQVASLALSRVHPSAAMRQRMTERSTILNQADPGRRMAMLVANPLSVEPDMLFRGSWKEAIRQSDPFSAYRQRAKTFRAVSPAQQMLYTDMEVLLPHTFLEKVDKINMLFGIEARVPFLDNELTAYVLSLPVSYKIRKRTTKHFLREVVRDLLPAEILHGRKKNFGTPMSAWLRSSLYPLVRQVFEEARGRYPFLNVDHMINLLEEHKRGLQEHAAILWRSAVLVLWLDRYKAKIDHTLAGDVETMPAREPGSRSAN